VPLNANALLFDSRVWDGAADDSFRVMMGDTELGTIDVTATDQTWTARSFTIPAELRNTVTSITFELTDGGTGFDHTQMDIDTVRFGMLAPQLQTSVAPNSIIDLGRITPGEIALLPMAYSFENVGDPGSILDVFGQHKTNLFPVSPSGQFDVFFTDALELEVGDPPQWQSVEFESYGAKGLFQTDVTYSTTVGPVTFRLQIQVVPESASWLILTIAGLMVTACRPGRCGGRLGCWDLGPDAPAVDTFLESR
jgi:hypothetical protein